jgi:hypothetical protein
MPAQAGYGLGDEGLVGTPDPLGRGDEGLVGTPDPFETLVTAGRGDDGLVGTPLAKEIA